ncbi:tubby-like F-box protein 5 isoform X2 [Nicotiana tabacum]|uniref:Tubby-like F-box protein 5 isoform X2 n=1 Tax=Nicotiana tabacum TaxID=4097 RepID=A0AC58SFB9_TOBAC
MIITQQTSCRGNEMALKSIIHVLKGVGDNVDSKSKKQAERKCVLSRGRSYVAPERLTSSPCLFVQESPWASLPHELLFDIIQRIEASEITWPARRDVVTCASVCRSWRETTKEVVRTPEQCGLLTFPTSLKQPGPRDCPIQCFIRRERATSTFRLYLGLSPGLMISTYSALSGDASKLLLTAKKIRRATCTDFLISMSKDDFSRASDCYVGKLRTKFVIYDAQPPCNLLIQSSGVLHKKFAMKKVEPKQLFGNHNVGTISYEVNVLRTRGPRRMRCTMHAIPFTAIQEGGSAPTPATFKEHVQCNSSLVSAVSNRTVQDSICSCFDEPVETIQKNTEPLTLRNKAPRWHEQLQCWCLNFKGRVTVASVKNFQLVASSGTSQGIPITELEKVILQFGKIGKDIFTMDYHYPLSAFQAFAICLSSFDTKPACE